MQNHIKGFKVSLLLVLTMFCLGGCASIISGRSQQLSFSSNPQGATVKVNGKIIGSTPISSTLPKKSGQLLVFEKEGYKPLSMQLETHLDPWFWGNIVLGGFVGSTTDGISGAVNEYSPNQYMISLEQERTTKVDASVVQPDKEKVVDFIVSGYRELSKDIQAGSGEYLLSLYSLLKIPDENRADALKRIKGLQAAYANISEFAEQVANLFLKEKR